MYSLQQKQCTTALIEKSRVFFRSIFLKFCMQVPTIYMITYIKSEKMPRLVRGRQPPRAAATQFALARTSMISYYNIEERKHDESFFVYCSIVRAGVAATRVAKMTISQGCHSRRVFLLYICNYRSHRYLHAKFQKD